MSHNFPSVSTINNFIFIKVLDFYNTHNTYFKILLELMYQVKDVFMNNNNNCVSRFRYL